MPTTHQISLTAGDFNFSTYQGASTFGISVSQHSMITSRFMHRPSNWEVSDLHGKLFFIPVNYSGGALGNLKIGLRIKSFSVGDDFEPNNAENPNISLPDLKTLYFDASSWEKKFCEIDFSWGYENLNKRLWMMSISLLNSTNNTSFEFIGARLVYNTSD